MILVVYTISRKNSLLRAGVLRLCLRHELAAISSDRNRTDGGGGFCLAEFQRETIERQLPLRLHA
jgi:hypothetical protein